MDLGYGKPPQTTRFRKGNSGNPGEKPGPRRAIERDFQEALENALLAAPDAVGKPGSACDRLAQQLTQSAILGDYAAIEMILALLPEKRRRVRVPARIVRVLHTLQAPAAHSQENLETILRPMCNSQGNSSPGDT